MLILSSLTVIGSLPEGEAVALDDASVEKHAANEVIKVTHTANTQSIVITFDANWITVSSWIIARLKVSDNLLGIVTIGQIWNNSL